MGVAGMRRYPSVVEAVIAEKGDITDTYAATLRTDAAVILEALVAEFSEGVVIAALANQGVAAAAYRCTLAALSELSRDRRSERSAGSNAPDA